MGVAIQAFSRRIQTIPAQLVSILELDFPLQLNMAPGRCNCWYVVNHFKIV